MLIPTWLITIKKIRNIILHLVIIMIGYLLYKIYNKYIIDNFNIALSIIFETRKLKDILD
jgi:hypothetical protein